MADADSSRQTAAWITSASKRVDLYTGKASDIVRALALTCIGVIWLFAAGGLSGDSPAHTLATIQCNRALQIAFWAAVAAAVLDLLQYLAGAMGWSLIRWGLIEALQVDEGATEIAWQTRAIWNISRVVGVPLALAEVLNVPTAGKEWPKMRDDIRKRISEKGSEVTEMINNSGTDGPSNVFDWLSTVLFWTKALAIISAYIALAIAVV